MKVKNIFRILTKSATDKTVLVAIKEIQKPVDYSKIDFNLCEYCTKPMPCDCPMKYDSILFI
jgi:hypothetical protein